MDADTDRIRFVVGLGNPGRKYQDTRHNVGFMVVEELARRWLAQAKAAFQGRLLEARPFGPGGPRRVLMLEPETYMNRSGRSVSEMLRFYKAQPSDVLVVLDDMALGLGQLRARPEGSAGGHNGLNDILQALGTRAVARLRVGIGSPPPRMDAADYVLAKFRPDEVEEIKTSIQFAADAVADWAFEGIDKVMQTYNRKADSTGN